MLTANEIKELIIVFDRRFKEGLREHANEVAAIRAGLASNHEALEMKITAINRSREALNEEETKAVDEYHKKKTEWMNALAIVESALRPDPEEIESPKTRKQLTANNKGKENND